MENKKRQTGEIIPREFGIRLAMPKKAGDLFVSPAAYMLGQIMLETPGEIRARIKDYAERNSLNLKGLEKEFVEAVRKREKSKNILNVSRRTATRQLTDLALWNVKHHGRTFTGFVKSKDKGEYEFSLPEPQPDRNVNIGYPGAIVFNPYAVHNEGKIKDSTVIGAHLAVPEIALAEDESSGLPRYANITGLFPKERRMKVLLPELPFTFNFFKSLEEMTDEELERHRLVTDLSMSYYLNGLSQYETSIAALGNQNVFSQELIRAITSSLDMGTFKVLRQKEAEIKKEDLTLEQDRRYASISALVERITGYLIKQRECYFAGYCREFVGTPWETVARRFEPRGKGPVYSLATSSSHPPIIVGRLLKHKAPNWTESYDPVKTDSLAKKIGLKYSLIDDVTRRESVAELILPDEALKKHGVHIPENLQKEYDSLRGAK